MLNYFCYEYVCHIGLTFEQVYENPLSHV